MKVAIIGAGCMGAAIARGIASLKGGRDSANATPGASATPADASANALGAITLAVTNPTAAKLDALRADIPGLLTSADNCEAVRGAAVVILAVKPWILPGVVNEIACCLEPGALLVSIAGGVGLADLERLLEDACGSNYLPRPLFQVIPDTAVSVGRGMTFIACRHASDDDVATVSGLFGAMGLTAVVEERLMNPATALSSCGIAYVYKYIQACVQAGVEMGFRPADALRYVLATVDGAVGMLQANGTLPQQEIDRVTTPGGMTIRGINALERSGFTAAVIDATLTPLRPRQ